VTTIENWADLLFSRCARKGCQTGVAALIDEYKVSGGSIDELLDEYREKYSQSSGKRGRHLLERIILEDSPMVAAMTACA